MQFHHHRKIGLIALATAIAVVAGWFGLPDEPGDATRTVETSTFTEKTRARMPVEDPVVQAAPGRTSAPEVPVRAAPVALPEPPRPAPPAPAVNLVERARQVEHEANRRLAQLTARFNLTEAQQSRIFPILAHSSKAYDPGLAVEGETESPETPFPTDIRNVEERIYDSLGNEQQVQLQVDQVERDLWWKNVMTRIDAATNEN